MAGNGTDRYASFPATDSMDNWKFTCWFNTASTAALQMLLGVTPSTASLIRLTNVNTSPVITVKMNSTTVNIDAASIVVGQDHKLVVEKIGTTVTVYVDDVQTGTTTNAAWTTGTVFDVIGALGDTTQVFGGIISYAEIKDLVTGITHTYNNTDNYESGGVVILPDSTGGQDGTWVNAVIGDLEYLPRTDRRYRIDEGGGATIFDSRGLPAQDGTIVNEDDANWNRS
jgi:hypothetical protein